MKQLNFSAEFPATLNCSTSLGYDSGGIESINCELVDFLLVILGVSVKNDINGFSGSQFIYLSHSKVFRESSVWNFRVNKGRCSNGCRYMKFA